MIIQMPMSDVQGQTLIRFMGQELLTVFPRISQSVSEQLS